MPWIIDDPMMTMGAGDIIFHPTNKTHYQLTSVNADNVTYRPIVFATGGYGNEIQVERSSLKGLVLLPMASG